nr:hypothetical protein Itr_chr02CG15010 [Ipomoea trifida]
MLMPRHQEIHLIVLIMLKPKTHLNLEVNQPNPPVLMIRVMILQNVNKLQIKGRTVRFQDLTRLRNQEELRTRSTQISLKITLSALFKMLINLSIPLPHPEMKKNQGLKNTLN